LSLEIRIYGNISFNKLQSWLAMELMWMRRAKMFINGADCGQIGCMLCSGEKAT